MRNLLLYPMKTSEALLWGILGMVFVLVAVLEILSWILHAIGLRRMAKRRGIYHAWFAWIPVLDQWLLGAVSDHYSYVKDRKKQGRRTGLLLLQLAITLVTAGSITAVSFLKGNGGPMEETLAAMISTLVPLTLFVLAILRFVFRSMAYYDVFRAAKPDIATLYLVLCIFLPVCIPFFVFSVRNQDEGMPPLAKKEESEDPFGWSEPEPESEAAPEPEAEQPPEVRREPEETVEPEAEAQPAVEQEPPAAESETKP